MRHSGVHKSSASQEDVGYSSKIAHILCTCNTKVYCTCSLSNHSRAHMLWNWRTRQAYSGVHNKTKLIDSSIWYILRTCNSKVFCTSRFSESCTCGPAVKMSHLGVHKGARLYVFYSRKQPVESQVNFTGSARKIVSRAIGIWTYKTASNQVNQQHWCHRLKHAHEDNIVFTV